MDQKYRLFLEAYHYALCGDTVPWTIEPPAHIWKDILTLADMHRVYPMVYEAVYKSEAAAKSNTRFLKSGMKKAIRLTMSQASMTAEFLRLYRFLANRGLRPIVMKGIICRDLYPEPEQRSSSDEDLLIPEELFEKYHKAFSDYGLKLDDQSGDINDAHEVSYYNNKVYIELHKTPFPPESKTYGDLNRFFRKVEEEKITEWIYGVPLSTMGHTDHLFYQLCHAYKHFLNCGIGIRLVSDILLYSMTYLDDIDWELVLERCEEICAMDFVGAIYRIGEKYLLPESFPCRLKEIWKTGEIDEEPFLLDVLSGGVYGTSSEDRLHSSNITLNAMDSYKNETSSHPIIQSMFPSFNYMRRRYPLVDKIPVLLPFAWLYRIITYLSASVNHGQADNNVSEALRIGNERVALMRRYHLIAEEDQGASFLKKAYRRTHKSALAPVLSPVFLMICALEYRFFDIKWLLQGVKKPGKKEQYYVRKNVSFIIKSFERQKLVNGLCRNISRIYPGVTIIVADDSKIPLEIDRPNVKVVHLPFNSGLSAGLDLALKQVTTPYVVRLDDDELLTRRSMIGRELQWLRHHPEVDLVGFGHITGIRCHSPEFNFKEYYKQPMEDAVRELKIPHMTAIDGNHIVLGKVANLYLARTDQLREVGFDPNIKVIDHHEFFWRAAGVITSVVALDTVIFHRHNPYDRQYNRYRSDFRDDLDYIRIKRNKIIREERSKQNINRRQDNESKQE